MLLVRFRKEKKTGDKAAVISVFCSWRVFPKATKQGTDNFQFPVYALGTFSFRHTRGERFGCEKKTDKRIIIPVHALGAQKNRGNINYPPGFHGLGAFSLIARGKRESHAI